jgi:hypothetical protein
VRIKVTGYIDTEDMSPEDADEGHEMGVSEDFFNRHAGGEPISLQEIEFEAEA